MAIGSRLATVQVWSPNHYTGRKYPITKITIHHMAGRLTAQACGTVFLPKSRKASSTYGIGYDGQIGQYVDEADAPWTSSDYDNDNRAITIEVSNSEMGGDWPISEESMEALLSLCVDICKRNPGIGKLNYTGDKTGNLTMHKWFAATGCPGPYLESKFPYIAEEVNRRLGYIDTEEEVSEPVTEEFYRVQVGAYSKKGNAFNMRAKLIAAGFEAYVVQVGDWYKVQVGAFRSRSFAEQQVETLLSAGFKAYVTTQSGTPVVEGSTPQVDSPLRELDMVTIKQDAPMYGSKKQFQPWVYSTPLYVREIKGDRIVVSTLKTGAVTGVVHKKYLTKV